MNRFIVVTGYTDAPLHDLAERNVKTTPAEFFRIWRNNLRQYDLVIARWGGLDIMVDPYTGSSSGTVRIVALQDVDVELRHASSFAMNLDVQTY